MTIISRCAWLIMIGSCCLIAASLAGTRSAAQPVSRLVPRTGEAAFALYGCSNCHATTGHGGGRAGPPVAATKLDYDSFLKQLRTPRTERMPPYRSSVMPDSDVRLIYSFLRSPS